MPQAAEPLELTPTISTRDEYLTECRKYLNTRWQHQGRSLKGIDCAGLLVVPALTLGILQPTDDVTNYGRTPHDETLTVLLHKHCCRLDDWHTAQPADILAIKYAGPQPQHLMVVTKSYDVRWGFHVIHAYGNSEMGGSVVEHRLDEGWLKSVRGKIHAAFHIDGIG